MSQIVIGIIVTVVGTVIANAIISGKGGRHFFGGGHYSGPVPVRPLASASAHSRAYACSRLSPHLFARDTPAAA